MPIEVITTQKQIEVLARKLKGVSIIGYDLEFSPLNPHDNSKLFLMSIAFNDAAYVIDFTILPLSAVAPLRAMLESKHVVKIGHNISIDWRHTYHHFNIAMHNLYDTMIAEEVITAGLDVEELEYIDQNGEKKNSGFSLAALLWRRFRIKLDKEVRNTFINYTGDKFTQEVYDYAGKDTLYLEQIYNQQQKEIAEKKLERTIKLEMRCVPHVARMEYNGILFNIEKCKEAVPVTDGVIGKMERWLQDVFISLGIAEDILITENGYTVVNTSSHKQLLEAFQKIDISVESTGKDVLKEWDFRMGQKWNERHKQDVLLTYTEDDTEDFDIAYVNTVLRHHEVRTSLAKFKKTYLLGLQKKYHSPTGKVYPSFRQCGARATGRFSSNNPNFQNMPRPQTLKSLGLGEYDVRSMFYAAPGTKFIISDYEGIELVLLSILSMDENLIDVILSGDAHSPVASMVSKTFGYDVVTDKNKKTLPYSMFRDVAKTLVYAKMYGSGAKNLLRKLSIPLATVGCTMTFKHAQQWIKQWNDMFPKAAVALEEAAKQAITQFYVETVLGRRRQWKPEVLLDNKLRYGAMREGANSKVQGTAADMIKLAVVRVCERLDTERSWLLGQIHDELLLQVTDDYVEEATTIIQREMVKAGEILFPNAPKGLIKTLPKVSTIYDK